MNTFRFYHSLWINLSGVIFCGLFVPIEFGPIPLVGTARPILVAGILFCLWRMLDRRPQVIVDEHGIFLRRAYGLIPWPEISSHEWIPGINGMPNLMLTFRTPTHWIAKAPLWVRLLRRGMHRKALVTTIVFNHLTPEPGCASVFIDAHITSDPQAAAQAGSPASGEPAS